MSNKTTIATMKSLKQHGMAQSVAELEQAPPSLLPPGCVHITAVAQSRSGWPGGAFHPVTDESYTLPDSS